MNLQQYIEPKLLILISVMIIGNGLKKSKYKYIPLLLGVISVVLAALWAFTANDLKGISLKKQNPKKYSSPILTVQLRNGSAGLNYEIWYCGHCHIDKQLDKVYMMYNETRPLNIN